MSAVHLPRMDGEPHEQHISMLLEMGLVTSRDEAIQRLKANRNDPERTIDELLTGVSSRQAHQDNTWDDNHFAGDRNGNYDPSYQHHNGGGNPWIDMDAFQIHHQPDNLRPDVFAAPSRLPSPINEREIIDLAPEHAAAHPSMSISFADREQENADLQKAMELSLGEMPQESGVTERHFGPATREHYESNAWAVTTTVGARVDEIYLDPEPIDRKRNPGEPVFLKPSTSGHRLASWLTIAHSIPLARTALLFPRYVLSDYGHDDEWWSGTPAKIPRVVHIEDGMDMTGSQDEVLFETQRLMAFLSKTNRSYGSAENLSKLDVMAEPNLDEIVSKFLTEWKKAAQSLLPRDQIYRIFELVAVLDKGQDKETHRVFQARLDGEEGIQTLYDAIAEALSRDIDEETDDTYFEEVPDVLNLVLVGVDGNIQGNGVRSPAVLYLDRYVASKKALMREMRQKKRTLDQKISAVEQLQNRLTSFSSPIVHGETFDPRLLLQAALARVKPPSPPQQANGVPAEGEEEAEDSDNPRDPQPSDNNDISGKLKEIYDKVVAKLEDLEEQKEKARADLRQLSKLLVEPSDNPKENPIYKYTLRGVCTEPHITYVLKPINEGDTDNTPDALARGEQWWRISFSTADAKPANKGQSYFVSSNTNTYTRSGEGWTNADIESWDDGDSLVANGTNWDRDSGVVADDGNSQQNGISWATKVSEMQVLKAAREESRHVVLVYANEEAMRVEVPELPTPLERFIETDNASFESELNLTRQPTIITTEHRSPKRKASFDQNDDDFAHWGDMAEENISPIHKPSPPPLPPPRNSKGAKAFQSIDEHTGNQPTELSQLSDAQNGDTGQISPLSSPFQDNPPPLWLGGGQQPEMAERSHLSPVAQAFKPAPSSITVNLADHDGDEVMEDDETRHIEVAQGSGGAGEMV